jgi:hypothetical protein
MLSNSTLRPQEKQKSHQSEHFLGQFAKVEEWAEILSR